MKTNLWIGLLAALVVCGFFATAPAQTKPDGSATLLELEADFKQVTAERGWDGYITYYADDSSELEDGGGIVTGKENIRKSLGTWEPGMSLDWTPVRAEMAASGDMGYTYGTFVFKSVGKDGKTSAHYGKYATVWKKQKDGSWKVAFDMGNSGPAPK